MNKEWTTKKLVDVATLQRGFDLPRRHRIGGEIPLVSSSGIIDTHNISAVRGPGVVTGRSGSVGNVFYIEGAFWPLNTVLYVKDFHGNDPRFIFHLLNKFDLKRFSSGAGVPTLNRNFVHDELVSIPPLREQRRIVGILDKAFDGIATAKANAEKNLQNARALFESHLQAVFTHGGEGSLGSNREDEVLSGLKRGIVSDPSPRPTPINNDSRGITRTGGRQATLRHIPGRFSLAVGMPKTPCRKGWRWTPLARLARLESGHTPSRKHQEYWGGVIPWIGIQ
ncbi:MAG TPA: restriction endonuclease subunit S, partial [Nitrospira sp.]|nr:restriction endonuclease subunit S [Nitrospira sp.]